MKNKKEFALSHYRKQKSFMVFLLQLGLFFAFMALSSISNAGNVWNKKVLDSALQIWLPIIKISPSNIPIVSYSETNGKSNGFTILLNENGSWILKEIAPTLEGSTIYSSSMAVDFKNRLHFSFLKREQGGGPLKQIYSLVDETSWTFEEIDQRGGVGSIDMALISDDSPVTCYNLFYEYTLPLRYQYELICKYRNSGTWEMLYDRSGYGYIYFPKISLDSNKFLHATYEHTWYDPVNNPKGCELVYEHQTETGWVYEVLVGGYSFTNSISNDALVIDSKDYPHMFYRIQYDGGDTQLRHTYKDETGWHTEVLSASDWFDGVSATIDSNDEIHISYRSEGWKGDPYYDPYRNFIAYSHKSSGTWKAVALDSCKFKDCESDQFETSIAVDSYNRPYVVYTFPKFINSQKYQKIVYANLKTEILAPNGGENIPAGSDYTIQWGAPIEASTFKLQYSLNNGLTWKLIANGLTGRTYEWKVPALSKNKKKCRVRVTAYDGTGRLIGRDKSDSPFSIEMAP